MVLGKYISQNALGELRGHPLLHQIRNLKSHTHFVSRTTTHYLCLSLSLV